MLDVTRWSSKKKQVEQKSVRLIVNYVATLCSTQRKKKLPVTSCSGAVKRRRGGVVYCARYKVCANVKRISGEIRAPGGALRRAPRPALTHRSSEKKKREKPALCIVKRVRGKMN